MNPHYPAPVQVTTILPAWMLADGVYRGLTVGQSVTTGLALAVVDAEATLPSGIDIHQSDEQPGFTTFAGRVQCPRNIDGSRVGTVLCTGAWAVVPFTATPLHEGRSIVAAGWLTAEPYLWADGSELARAVPSGRRRWRVTRIYSVGKDEPARSIERLPDQASVDPDAAYLLQLTTADRAGGPDGPDGPGTGYP